MSFVNDVDIWVLSLLGKVNKTRLSRLEQALPSVCLKQKERKNTPDWAPVGQADVVP